MTARLIRRAVVLVALPALVLVSLVAGAAPAGAQPSGRVLVSTDGLNWHTGAVTGLLSDLGGLVPGSSRSDTLYVKNDSSTPAILRVSARVDATAASDYSTGLTIAAVPAGAGESAIAVVPGECLPLFDGSVLAPAAVAKLGVTVALAVSASNSTQSSSAPVTFYVSLVEDVGFLPPVSCVASGVIETPPGSGGGSGLAGTGADVAAAVAGTVTLAAGLVALGLLLLAARRRERRSQ